MSRRVVSLPFRLASAPIAKPQSHQWVCRRCLATQPDTTTTTPSSSGIPPITPASQTTTSDLTTAASSTIEPSTGNASAATAPYDPTLPSAQRSYPLKKTDHFLKKALPHPVPIQFLQHATSPLLPAKERQQQEGIWAGQIHAPQPLVGVVVSAGKMEKTVRVRVPGQTWNKRIGKYFGSATNYLVHDPNSSLVAGDVIAMHKQKTSATVHHVVASIVAPFGSVGIDARPPIPSPDERLALYKEKRFAKLKRRELRKAAAGGDEVAILELERLGLGEKEVVVKKDGRGRMSAKKAAKAARAANVAKAAKAAAASASS